MVLVNPTDFVRRSHSIALRYNMPTLGINGLTDAQLFAGQWLCSVLAPSTAPLRLVIPSFTQARKITIRRNFSVIAFVASTVGPAFVLNRVHHDFIQTDGTGTSSPVEYSGQAVSDGWVGNPHYMQLNQTELQTIDYTSAFVTATLQASDYATSAVFALAAIGHAIRLAIETIVDVRL